MHAGARNPQRGFGREATGLERERTTRRRELKSTLIGRAALIFGILETSHAGNLSETRSELISQL